VWQEWERREKNARSDWQKLVTRDNLKNLDSVGRTRLKRILKKQAGPDYFAAGRSKWRANVDTVIGLRAA